MQLVVLEKSINLAAKIDELLEVNLDDNIEYHYQKDGVMAIGQIAITGKFISDGQEESFSNVVAIDIFAPIENIVSRESLKFQINDFDYKIKDETINFYLKIKINGWKELDNTFLAEDIQIPEKVAQDAIKKEIKEEDTTKAPEIVSKVPEITEEKLVELVKNEVKENLEGISELVQEEENSILVIEPTITPEEIMKNINILQEDKKELSAVVQPKEVKSNSYIKDLFSSKKEVRNVCWRYHSVCLDETYLEIAELYEVDESQLKLLNNNTELKEGKLIFIP